MRSCHVVLLISRAQKQLLDLLILCQSKPDPQTCWPGTGSSRRMRSWLLTFLSSGRLLCTISMIRLAAFEA